MQRKQRLPESGASREEWNLAPMTRADLPAVLAIENASFAIPWPLDAFAAELDTGCGTCVVARSADAASAAIAGYICYWILEGELVINNIAVAAAHRRRGLGARLLAHAFDAARAAACHAAWLEVRPSNVAALALYERYGFSTVSRRRAYYSDNREDALVMRAPLKALEKR